MLAGPAGLTTAQVAQKARDCGWETWDVDKAKKKWVARAGWMAWGRVCVCGGGGRGRLARRNIRPG
jgi:hypothetical protein